MALPSVGGGYQFTDGNTAELTIGVQPAPQTATSTATLSVAQIIGGILLGSPGSSAAAYTLPTVALLEAVLTNAKIDSAFMLSVMNVDGSGSGVITMTAGAGTGWTAVGLMTVAATAGTSQLFLCRKTGVGAWLIYRYA